jgi:hypothetical protein
MDDTVVRKTGTKTPGVAYRRDPLSPAFHVNFIRAQRFLQLSALLPDGNIPGPARAIPLRYEHVPPVPKPRKDASEEDWQAYKKQKRAQNLSTHGVRILQQMRQELDQKHQAQDRLFVTVVDGSYTNKTVLKGLPDRTVLIGRIRKDADLFYPPREEDHPPVGPKCQYGRSAPTPEQLRQDETIPWQNVTVYGAGRFHTFRVKTLSPILWRKAGADHPLRLIVVAPVGYRPRKGSKILYRQPAHLICTQPDLPLEQILQYYLWRWDIEVNHRDEKQIIGVGEAQVRATQSVDHQPAMAVASYAILLLAATRAYGTAGERGSLPLPKWQSKKPGQRLSTQELTRELRSEVMSYALEHLEPIHDNYSHFVTPSSAVAKWPQSQLPAASALLYATG